MKKLSYILVAALALFAAACNPKEEGGGDSTVTLSVFPTSLPSFEADATSAQTFTVSATGSWTVSATDTWIHYSPATGSANGTVSVTVDKNESQARAGKVTVASGNLSKDIFVSQKAGQAPSMDVSVIPADFDGVKRASTTYQLLVYSFADGKEQDDYGDFQGIIKHLDYLDALGVTALWLSPIHPADSYHGYDVQDYYTVNSLFGTEEEFKSLIDAAHEKGIKIYIDYVLNHSGKGHPWFSQALADESSPYRNYYFISSNPAADYSTFPMLNGTSYKSNEWKSSPRLTISKTTEDITSGNADWNLWFWQTGQEGKEISLVNKGDGTYYAVLDINGDCGMLVRKYHNWNDGSKHGVLVNATLSEGKTIDLVRDGGDISFSGSGRYKVEISDVNRHFMGAFGTWMPDLNYGNVNEVENNPCFIDLTTSADKWINIGIDGFRLDAVKHICGGIDSYNNTSNQTFLSKWYEHCNATYKARGHNDDIFMVGEVWDTSHDNEEKFYYRGINSCFEFAYWPLLYNTLTQRNASNYVSTITRFIKDHKDIRSDAITSLFMTNHDHSSKTGSGEVRSADDLGKDLAKEKQAAAIMLTTEGKPFVYQGEELGYWGNSKDRGDEYLRAPIVWDADGKDCAKKGVNDKVDNSMLTGSISVAAQMDNEQSLLNTYITWSRLRNTFDALANGSMSKTTITGTSIASWYMTSGSQKLLVIHNVDSKSVTVTVSDKMDVPRALLGTASIKDKTLTLGANSSVVFEL